MGSTLPLLQEFPIPKTFSRPRKSDSRKHATALTRVSSTEDIYDIYGRDGARSLESFYTRPVQSEADQDAMLAVGFKKPIL
jgi:hypothetical protein